MTLFQDNAPGSLTHENFQFLVALSMCINEKILIECPSELKCSEVVVTISGKCFISHLFLFFLFLHFADFVRHIVC